MAGALADVAGGLDGLPDAAFCGRAVAAVDALPFLPAGVRLHAARLLLVVFRGTWISGIAGAADVQYCGDLLVGYAPEREVWA